MKTFKKISITIMTLMFFMVLSGIGTATLQAQEGRFRNPDWAPAYYPGVRYYYIPDIETFYDLSNQDFVYLDDGQWLFSNDLPPMYAGFDLYGAYIIALNRDVFNPWMHFHLYLSNYPRYYYRSHYRDEEIRNIRGFNENVRKPFYWTQEDRNRINDLRKSSNHEIKAEKSRPAQKSNYYGKYIGQPVKVKPQMRENRGRNETQKRR